MTEKERKIQAMRKQKNAAEMSSPTAMRIILMRAAKVPPIA